MTSDLIREQINKERKIRSNLFKRILRFIVTFLCLGMLLVLGCVISPFKVDVLYRIIILCGTLVATFGYGMFLLVKFLASLERELGYLTLLMVNEAEDLILRTAVKNEEDE